MREHAHQVDALEIDDEIEQATDVAGDQDQQRQSAGEIPPVAADATRVARPSPSELAYDSKPKEDKNQKELREKVGALVAKHFGGDYRKAFDHYDADNDGGVKKDEIVDLLKDAGVGNGLTRGAWANGILKKLDKSRDSKIQWSEFETVFKAAPTS